MTFEKINISAFGLDERALAKKRKSRLIIPGVMILQKGVPNDNRDSPSGHPVVFDDRTLSTLVSAAKLCKKGVKALMNHSGDIREIIGKFLNFRIEGESVRADLHLLKSSHHADYILEVVDEMPDEFGVSISAQPFFEDVIINDDESMSLFRCEKIFSCDLVTEPAATSGLFSINNKQKNNMPEEDIEVKKPVDLQDEQPDKDDVRELIGALASRMDSMETMLSKFTDDSNRKEKLEDDPEKGKQILEKVVPEVDTKPAILSSELESRVLKMAADTTLETLSKLGINQGIRPNAQTNVDSTKMDYSSLVSREVSNGKTDKESHQFIQTSFPDKYSEFQSNFKK